jgi:hypothetical protein
LAGGSARAGGGGGGSYRCQIRPHAALNVENEKTSDVAHFLAYKSLKTPFFAQKYFKRYTPETFFEEYNNFNIFLTSGIEELYLFKV